MSLTRSLRLAQPRTFRIHRLIGLSLAVAALLIFPGVARAAGSPWFGLSVGLSGNTAVVGSPYARNGAGAVYVYVRSGTTWSRQAKLSDPGPIGYDEFGISVALSGDTLLVGARTKTVAGQGGAGAAYVYVRSGTSWTRQATLKASDAAPNADFGFSVALSGDTALVGAPWSTVAGQSDAGTAYVFERSGTTWSPQAELSDPDAVANDEFGRPVVLSNGTALIGASGTTVGGLLDAGAVYVYDGSGADWSQDAVLTDPDTTAWEAFGNSLALSGGTALIGADCATTGGQDQGGAAYVFAGSGASWTPQAELTASSPESYAHFGNSVAISDTTAIVGATGLSGNYVFTGSGASWSQQTQLMAPGGQALALSSDTALIGAFPFDAAYVFAGSGASWSQQVEYAPPVNTGQPTVSGAPEPGNTLSCSTGTWTGVPAPTLTYRWLRDGAIISGAQAKTYLVTTADQGHTLVGQVIGTNSTDAISATSTNSIAIPASTPTLTLAASATSLKIGSSVTLSGTVASALPVHYRAVTISRVTSGGTTTLKTLTLSSTNTFSTTYKPTSVATWQFQASYRVGAVTYKSTIVTVSVHT